jgi:hypothetical protein
LCDDALTERFGRTARQRYESLFSGAALGKAYADLYRHVIEEGGNNADDRS